MADKEKPLEWIASSYKDLMALPPDVHRRFGYALSLAQMGDQDDAAKVLKCFGGAGVLEDRIDVFGRHLVGRDEFGKVKPYQVAAGISAYPAHGLGQLRAPGAVAVGRMRPVFKAERDAADHAPVRADAQDLAQHFRIHRQ